MEALFAGGRIVDWVLILLGIEALAILVLYRFARVGPGLGRVLPFLVAGACLLLAWRTAAAGLPWPVSALLLLGAGGAHVVDLWRRWP